MTKTCPACLRVLPLSDYCTLKRGGYYTYCKACASAKSQECRRRKQTGEAIKPTGNPPLCSCGGEMIWMTDDGRRYGWRYCSPACKQWDTWATAAGLVAMLRQGRERQDARVTAIIK